LAKDFLTKNNVTKLVHPPYSAELASAEVYLLPAMKSALYGRRFCDVTDIIKNATGELKRLSQNSFRLPGIFPTTIQCWQNYIFAQCDYF
jgi:hypothetical protein